MKKLTISITETQREDFLALRRGGSRHTPGDIQLERIINLHRADEQAATLRGDPDELDSKEAALVIEAGRRMLARNPRTTYAGIADEMNDIRRTHPPEGIPKRHHFLIRVLTFGKAT